MNAVTLTQILDARERRVAKQKELLDKFGKTLICFTMNIPGPVKVDPQIEAAFRIGDNALCRFRVLHREDTSAETGFEKFYVVEGDSEAIKSACCAIEEQVRYGRLYDIDVLIPDGQKLSRSTPRKCLICEKDAAICGRSRAHTVAELQKAVHTICADSITDLVTDGIASALLTEVSTTPKPGLVDRNNSGSHRDMDIRSFEKSCFALYPYFRQCAQMGQKADDPTKLFRQLRILGMEAEKNMLEATGGVNTHKGAIFSMGIAAAAAARCFPKTDPETVLGYCAQMSKWLVSQDFGSITEPKTAGEKLYMEHGITGIRGQAEQGFPAALNVGYPVLQEGLRRGLNLNDAGCATLLHLLAVTDDTNLINRSNPETLKEIQGRLQALLAADPYPDLSVIEDLDKEFIARNLSPGGSADLLALTYFLYFLNN